jgi:hypothetical protein
VAITEDCVFFWLHRAANIMTVLVKGKRLNAKINRFVNNLDRLWNRVGMPMIKKIFVGGDHVSDLLPQLPPGFDVLPPQMTEMFRGFPRVLGAPFNNFLDVGQALIQPGLNKLMIGGNFWV